MARHLNRVSLIGNLGKDLRQGTFSTGTPYATFSVATTESYQDRESNWRENTEWHRVSAVGRIVDVIAKQFATGALVFVEGKSRTRTLPATDQLPERSFTEVLCTEWSLLHLPASRAQAPVPPPADPPAAPPQTTRASSPRKAPPAPVRSAPPPNYGDEDIPFHELDAPI